MSAVFRKALKAVGRATKPFKSCFGGVAANKAPPEAPACPPRAASPEAAVELASVSGPQEATTSSAATPHTWRSTETKSEGDAPPSVAPTEVVEVTPPASPSPAVEQVEMLPFPPPTARPWDGIEMVVKMLAGGGCSDIHLVDVGGRRMVVKTGRQEEDDEALLYELGITRQLLQQWGGRRHPNIMLVEALVLPRAGLGGAPMGIMMDAMECDAYDLWFGRLPASAPGIVRLLSAALVLGGAARALRAVHQAQYCHLDVKLGNVLVGRLRSGMLPLPEDVRLTDFGVAEPLEEDGWVRPGVVGGTPEMAAPEQHWWRGCGAGQVPQHPPAYARVGPPADVWALGAMLAWMAGDVVCRGEVPTEQEWHQIARGLMGWCMSVGERGPQVFRLLEGVLQGCLCAHPLHRCSTDFVVQQLDTVVVVAGGVWEDACERFAPLLAEY